MWILNIGNSHWFIQRISTSISILDFVLFTKVCTLPAKSRKHSVVDNLYKHFISTLQSDEYWTGIHMVYTANVYFLLYTGHWQFHPCTANVFDISILDIQVKGWWSECLLYYSIDPWTLLWKFNVQCSISKWVYCRN